MAVEIILLRGLFRGSYHWGDFPERLRGIYPESVISCIDIPGNGYLFSEASPKTISGMVESIRKQRKSEGKVYILAVSMGGMIALKWAELYPEEIESVICVNTSAKGFSPFYERLLPQNYIKIVKALFSSPFKREAIIYEMVSNQPFNKATVNEWESYCQSYPMSISNFWCQIIAAIQFVISRPKCDLHFIASSKDRLVNFKATKAIANSWDIPIIVNEIDGHDIALDNPKWLLSLISSIWIKS